MLSVWSIKHEDFSSFYFRENICNFLDWLAQHLFKFPLEVLSWISHTEKLKSVFPQIFEEAMVPNTIEVQPIICSGGRLEIKTWVNNERNIQMNRLYTNVGKMQIT